MSEKHQDEEGPARQGPVAASVEFLKGVRGETQKVTWPAWNDTRKATAVVLVFTFVCAMFLGGVDFVLSRAVEWVVR